MKNRRNKKYILVTHQKGGVGKSTLTFNLAICLAQASKVAIIDMDPQGSLAQLSSTVKDFDISPYQGNRDSVLGIDADFIFVDTPPYLTNHLVWLIELADLIIIPTKAGVLDLMAIHATITIMKGQDAVEKCLIVLNMIKPNTTLTLDILIELEKFKDVKIADNQVSDLVAFTRSILNQGLESNKKAKNQIDALSEEILRSLL